MRETAELKKSDGREAQYESQVADRYSIIYGQGLTPKELACLEVIENSPYPLPPREIARITKIKPNSCRVYLSRLRRKGSVFCPFRGFYQSAKNVVATERVGGSVKVFSELPLPRLHKLAMLVEGLDRTVLRHSEAVSDNDFYRLTFV